MNPLGVGDLMGLILGPNCISTKDVKICTHNCWVWCKRLIVYEYGGMPWPKTCATHYQARLRLADKGRATKWLVVCWGLDHLYRDILNQIEASHENFYYLWAKAGSKLWICIEAALFRQSAALLVRLWGEGRYLWCLLTKWRILQTLPFISK